MRKLPGTYYSRNKEKMLARQKEYQRTHVNEVKERAHAYYLKNKERISLRALERKDEIAAGKRANRLKKIEMYKEKDRAYYLANREHRIAWQKEYYKKNSPKVRSIGKAWRDTNPEAVKANSKAYRESHRDYRAAHNAKRRALKAGVEISPFTGKDWIDMKAAYGHRCVYCGHKKRLTQDHVVPLSRGGKHDKTNIVPACQSCNSRKNARQAPPYQRVLFL